MFGALMALMICGILLAMAASPPVAQRLGLDSFHFVYRQFLFAFPALALMFCCSMLNAKLLRRLALLIVIAGFGLMVMTLLVGPEVKGATRWIPIAGFALQPSELMKPGFVVLSAWLFSESIRRPDIPGRSLATILYAAFVGLLLLQPDFGQTLLVTAVWIMMFFMTGLSWMWIPVLGGLGIIGIFSAYTLLPHVARRIDLFLDPSTGDNYQVGLALDSFIRGGWFGLGPGEGQIKRILPDAHSDFIFSVAAEEFGIIACLLLVFAFAFIVFRGLSRCFGEVDPFIRLATLGLVSMFGLQAFINMAVNLSLLPAKGMTLPFISYGGSSFISVAIAMGFVLALTRKRPGQGYGMSYDGRGAAMAVEGV
jgi:cell division protein FtsW